MNVPLAAFALVALLPAVTNGALPGASHGDPLILALCSGGSMALAPGSAPPLPRGAAPCCAKGCRNSDRKRMFDPKQ
jgi:hypothetical protein